ncbi:thermonuclease family protein [Sphingomonas endolithica]|uniref:thermonuclease family protein n=1 Tax=Sphingomonas endolithica TaxID=2972485 RepID=UPI0021AE9C99|nr:thermonuclease family protein [Sphingomonas sp. ZFBP2030]
MRYDYQFHRQRGRQATFGQQRRRGGGGIALMLLAGVFAGLVIERAVPDLPFSRQPPGVVGTRFGLCFTGGGQNCVVDGDTFWMAGEKIRIADIDTPETHPSRCALEADLGGKATLRLQALLNAGPVTLASADRDTDRYGRKLRIVERGGESLGDTLVAEGLARPWAGRRRPWCV